MFSISIMSLVPPYEKMYTFYTEEGTNRIKQEIVQGQTMDQKAFMGISMHSFMQDIPTFSLTCLNRSRRQLTSKSGL